MRIHDSHVTDIYIYMKGLWEERSVLRGYFHYSTIPCVNSVYRGDLLIKVGVYIYQGVVSHL